MKSVSVNLLAPAAVLAMLILLSTTASVDGRVATTTSDELPQEYKIIIEKVMIIEPNAENGNDDEKTKMIVMAQGNTNGLECAGKGGYCNIFFGPSCCSEHPCITLAGIAGGFCSG
ncbi:hypothetical protein SOVF_201350 [Spinacia oleracea]|uniref:Invertebrate defensins family profile domain-containing protein n=1 Tax=Spinacia oleracea TaxID=3562 RepID=A0A9R0IMG9_SPIOL|nr:uncharacterized protein LOC110790358 [Spinacia oleracea]KNA04256.1 hypothetical protein SOVF_201350 [Spinacia oleracea]